MNRITGLRYSTTNTYLIEGERGMLLFDTGWAGTFPAFCHALGEAEIPLQKIDYILISHFHPDHMGIAQEIAEHGPVIILAEPQKDHVHAYDEVLLRDRKVDFHPVREDRAKVLPLAESRSFLRELGIDGEILSTPGHSEDSITLALDDGTLFVGDLNPLYELEMHRETLIGDSWEMLLARSPKTVYYGHARPYNLQKEDTCLENRQKEDACLENRQKEDTCLEKRQSEDLYALVEKICRYIDKGLTLTKITGKTGADPQFTEDVSRMYLTHRNVGVQGILDRIEIKNR